MDTPEFPEGASPMLAPDDVLGGASLTAKEGDLQKIAALLRANGMTVAEVKRAKSFPEKPVPRLRSRKPSARHARLATKPQYCLHCGRLSPLFAVGSFVFAGRSPLYSDGAFSRDRRLEPYLRPSPSTNPVILHVSVGKQTTEFAIACLPS